MNVVFNGRDSDLDVEDPLPFFMRNHFQMPYLLLDTLRRANPWLKLDFCIGKVIELNANFTYFFQTRYFKIYNNVYKRHQ